MREAVLLLPGPIGAEACRPAYGWKNRDLPRGLYPLSWGSILCPPPFAEGPPRFWVPLAGGLPWFATRPFLPPPRGVTGFRGHTPLPREGSQPLPPIPRSQGVTEGRRRPTPGQRPKKADFNRRERHIPQAPCQEVPPPNPRTPSQGGYGGLGDTPRSPERGHSPFHPHTPFARGYGGSAKADPWPKAKEGRFQSRERHIPLPGGSTPGPPYSLAGELRVVVGMPLMCSRKG